MASVLFEKCVKALAPRVIILSKEQSDEIFNLFEKKIPIYKGGSRIDWDKINNQVEVTSAEGIIPELGNLLKKTVDDSVFILWNNLSVPVIKTNLQAIVEHFDEVTCVSFETWFFNPSQGYIIEFYYLGEMHVGLLP